MNELQLFFEIADGVFCFAFVGSICWLMTIEV